MAEHRPSLSRRGFIARVCACLILPRVRPVAPDAAAATGDASPAVALSFPRDDGPHEALTEWWYYTGQLVIGDGTPLGFEQVVFKARRDRLSGFASHVAITDSSRRRFRYDQRAVIDDGSIAKPAAGFDLTIGDWSMRGGGGSDELAMALPGYAYALRLRSEKPPVLHGGHGYILTGAGAESYYYSRTRLTVAGTLVVDGVESAVTGEAWMDHQWGNFTSFSNGGWDWFSVQLDDDTEVMIYRYRDDADVSSPGVASYVRADGSAVALAADDVTVEVDATWLSPDSGARYPSAWKVSLPGEVLILDLVPTMPDQELDTRETTGVTYWEGQVVATGTRAGSPIGGKGYVELTGYTRERDGVVP